jgi:nucleotide-binding universal stress UspA family protein
VTASDGPYRQVVVGTDGSSTAQEAVTHAAELALACGGRLTVVSAYTRHETRIGELEAPPDDDDSGVAIDAAGAQDHVIAGQELARATGLRELHGRTEAGDPAAVLLDVASDIGADVIVVGSRGLAAPSRFLLGSVPNRVSHHAGCDVVIVRTAG